MKGTIARNSAITFVTLLIAMGGVFSTDSVAFAQEYDYGWGTGAGAFDYGWGSGSDTLDYGWGTGSAAYDYGWGSGVSDASTYDYGWGTGNADTASLDYGWGTGGSSFDYGSGSDTFDYGWGTGQGASYLDDSTTRYLDDSPLRYQDDANLRYLDDAPLRYLDDAHSGSYGVIDYFEEYWYEQSCGGCDYSYRSYSTPSYSRPVTVGSGFSAGRPTTHAYTSPIAVSTGRPARTSGATTISNIDNSVRIIDNSINNSFNTGSNVNSPGANIGATTVSIIPIALPQYTTGYTYTAPVSTVSCSVYASPSSIQNGQYSTLNWTSSGASYARISDGLGNVSTTGSLTVRPDSSRSYVVTVTDSSGRTNTCQTYVTVNASSPYVALSQIPYTGFDFGPFGNAIYWISLLSFAVAGAYLMVYYLPAQAGKGGMLALAGGYMTATRPSPVRVSLPTAHVAEKTEMPVVSSTPTARTTGTTDVMRVVTKAGEAPRIMILRS